MHTHIKNIFFAITVFVSVFWVSAAPAKAATTQAVGCYGASCRGKDPEVMGCGADARTLASVSAPGLYRVDLRYSTRCNARWSRTTLTHAPDWETFAVAYVGSGSVTSRRGSSRTVWSAMWSGVIKACGGYETLDGRYVRCTAAR